MNPQTTNARRFGVEPVQTPSPEHAEFDQITAQIQDFEPLPWQTVPVLEETDQPDEHETDVDREILTGLVSPV